jgi:hypothetical protein
MHKARSAAAKSPLTKRVHNRPATGGTPADWAVELRANLACNPTARRAWRKLCEVGLYEAGLYFLWNYGHCDREFKVARQDAKRIANQVRDAVRALHIAESGKKPKRAKDPLIFFRRLLDHLKTLESPLNWPFSTANDAPLILHRALCEEMGRPIPLQFLERHFKFLSGRSGPLRREAWLRKLQEVATIHGFALSLRSLVALAECAAEFPVEPTRLSRTFRRWTSRYPNLHMR